MQNSILNHSMLILSAIGQSESEKIARDAGDSTPRKNSEAVSQTTQDIWGDNVDLRSRDNQSRGVSADGLLFYEDELDKHESMIALVNLLERSGHLDSDDNELPVWQILSSLQSPDIHRYTGNH